MLLNGVCSSVLFYDSHLCELCSVNYVLGEFAEAKKLLPERGLTITTNNLYRQIQNETANIFTHCYPKMQHTMTRKAMDKSMVRYIVITTGVQVH